MVEKYPIGAETWIGGRGEINPRTPVQVVGILQPNGTITDPQEADIMRKKGYTQEWLSWNEQFHGFGIWKRQNTETMTWGVCVHQHYSLSGQGTTLREAINELYQLLSRLQSSPNNSQAPQDIRFVNEITVVH